MKHFSLLCYLVIILAGLVCNRQPDYLLKTVRGEWDEPGVPCASISTAGDTLLSPWENIGIVTPTPSKPLPLC